MYQTKLNQNYQLGFVTPFIHSFILNIYIAPLQENYSEAHLPLLAFFSEWMEFEVYL